MKTYYKTIDGIDTGEYFVPNNHPKYNELLAEIQNKEAVLLDKVENSNSVVQETWETIRVKRNALLKETDWVALPDVVVSTKVKWLTYRVMLRQLPQLYSDPNKVVWPIKPN